MDVIMVRHGESNWNLEPRYQGHADSGLTDRGRAQAAQVAEVLAEEVGHHEVVWSSDLPRARDTAEAYAQLAGATVRIDERLREVDVGSWAGHTLPEIAAAEPEVVAASRAGRDPRRGGGETFAELRTRVVACLEEIARGEAQTTLVFSHGGAIQVAAAHAANAPSPGHYAMSSPSNCSRTVLRLTPDRAALVKYNMPLPGAQETY